MTDHARRTRIRNPVFLPPNRFTTIADGAGPDPTDSRAWLEFARSRRLASVRPGAIVEALRVQVQIGDQRAANALVAHLSLIMTRRLRAMIGTNHPGRGEPMVEEAHGNLLLGLFDPAHGDYHGLVEAFGTRITYRAVDAIRTERRFNSRHESYDAMPGGIAAVKVGRLGSATGSIDVEHMLTMIPDLRKRLAFRLYMDGAQVRAGRNNIAEALGIDPKTAAKWIVEIRTALSDAMNTMAGLGDA